METGREEGPPNYLHERETASDISALPTQVHAYLTKYLGSSLI